MTDEDAFHNRIETRHVRREGVHVEPDAARIPLIGTGGVLKTDGHAVNAWFRKRTKSTVISKEMIFALSKTFVVAALQEETPLPAVADVGGEHVGLELHKVGHSAEILAEGCQKILNVAGGHGEVLQVGIPVVSLVKLRQDQASLDRVGHCE